MSRIRFNWTAEHVDTLRQLYPDHTADVVARVIGCTTSAAYQKAAGLGLKKSEAFKASDMSGRIQRGKQDPRMAATQFKPGEVSWNKGKKYQPGGRSVETRFKPGRKPEESRNYVPIGATRISKDGYLERKVSDDQNVATARRWVAVHRLAWQEAHGPIPKDHVVTFKLGQKTAIESEITDDRLECISRAEHARRNHPAGKNPELFKLIQLKGAITRQVNRIAKEKEAQQP
jgi:hypothetical protein